MKDNKNHYVYEITNNLNGMKYIGKRSCTCPIEDDSYMGSGKSLVNDFKKYGKENFSKKILEVCNTEKKAYSREKYWIEYYNAVRSDNYYNKMYGHTGSIKKKVICLNTGDVFDTITEASKYFGVDATGITKACNGKRKTGGKHPTTQEPLRWMYYDKYKRKLPKTLKEQEEKINIKTMNIVNEGSEMSKGDLLNYFANLSKKELLKLYILKEINQI